MCCPSMNHHSPCQTPSLGVQGKPEDLRMEKSTFNVTQNQGVSGLMGAEGLRSPRLTTVSGLQGRHAQGYREGIPSWNKESVGGAAFSPAPSITNKKSLYSVASLRASPCQGRLLPVTQAGVPAEFPEVPCTGGASWTPHTGRC